RRARRRARSAGGEGLMPTAPLSLGVMLSAFLLGLIFGGPYIRLLRRFGIGIRGRHKLVWQTIVAVAAAIYIQKHFAVNGIFVPLVGEWLVGAVVFGIIAVIAIVGTSNGVNLTDGMDGLAGGTSVFAFLAFAFIAADLHYDWLVVFCAAMVGG